MKAVYISEFGENGSIGLRDVPDPSTPNGSEVLVRVRAAGLNRADLLQRLGLYPPPPGYSPNIPGMEFAGEIAAIGRDATGWKIGDRVFGITAGEAQAESLLIDASLLAAIPPDLDIVEAAAIPEVFITAHDALFTQAGLKSGETLLVHAVGSGVGLAALQLAKAAGAVVIGTSRTSSKLEKCREYGLDTTIVAAGPVDFARVVLDVTGGRGADVILDLVGGTYLNENLNCLAGKGRLMLVGLTAGRSAELNMGLVLARRAHIIGTVMRPRTVVEKAATVSAFAADVIPLLESGKVRPNVDRVFPAGEAGLAYRYLQSNESFGKVILEF